MRRSLTAACAVLILLSGCGSDPGVILDRTLLTIPTTSASAEPPISMAFNGSTIALVTRVWSTTPGPDAFHLRIVDPDHGVLSDRPLVVTDPGLRIWPTFWSSDASNAGAYTITAFADGWILGRTVTTEPPPGTAAEIITTLFRLNPDGSADPTWGTDGSVELDRGVTFLPDQGGMGSYVATFLLGAGVGSDGSLTVLAGRETLATHGETSLTMSLRRFTATGAVDSTFNGGSALPAGSYGNADGRAFLTLANDNSPTVAFVDQGHVKVAKFTAAGAVDDSFGSGGLTDLPTAFAAMTAPPPLDAGCFVGDGAFVAAYGSNLYLVHADGSVRTDAATPLTPLAPLTTTVIPRLMTPAGDGSCVLSTVETSQQPQTHVVYRRVGSDGHQQLDVGTFRFFDYATDLFVPQAIAKSPTSPLIVVGDSYATPLVFSYLPSATLLRSITI